MAKSKIKRLYKMLTKLIIPVIDTESLDFDFRGNLTRDEYGEMVMDKFLKTNNQMNKFVDNIRRGVSNIPQNLQYSSTVHRDFPDIVYNFFETDVYIENGKKQNIDETFFERYINSGEMFILILNINPNMEPDAESELRFWLDDSKKIHNDTMIDTKTKLKALPQRGLKILIGKEEYVLEGCKILQDYPNEKYPFKFAIIVEKITSEK